MEEKILREFNEKMTYERVNNNSKYEKDIKISYLEILNSIVINYNEYRKYVPELLYYLESNDMHSISYSMALFYELYESLIEEKIFKAFDLSILYEDPDMETIKKVNPILKKTYSQSSYIRLSETKYDISALSEKEKRGIASAFISKLQNDCKQLIWSNELVHDTLIQLSFLRELLNSLGNIELFYHSIGMFLYRLSSSELYQTGRDIAEEIIIVSYKDNVPEFGYFNSFRFYSNTHSIHASLLYVNLSLICTLQKDTPYSEKYIKEIIWQSMKFFRNVHLIPWATQIYQSTPKNLKFIDYERRAFDHTYFTVLLTDTNPQAPSMLLDYLNKEREDILSGGINESIPWLLTLYNLKKQYPNADFSSTGFGFYLSVLESIVPSETIKKQKNIIEGNNSNLKNDLNESLIKLNQTRNLSDFFYDNETALKISNRLIEYSVSKNDAPGFLLAMVLKSDYSIVFQQKNSHDVAPLVLPNIKIDSLGLIYEDRISFINSLPIVVDCNIIWIAFSEEKMFQLSLINNSYSFIELKNWNYQNLNNLLREDYFVNLEFSETLNDKGGVRIVLPEEFKQEAKKVSDKLNFSKLTISLLSESVYVIKDMELSRFPHNLFLNQDGEFIAKNIPITNVLSTEWLLQKSKIEPIAANYSKSIWIPTESSDITINYLYNNIEDTLNNNSFNVYKQIELEKPLSSDINIICSHGAKNISEIQAIFNNDVPIYNLGKIIGKGRVLIFFVCYSGSMNKEFFRNNVTSLIKRFIGVGYDAVIAPFWGLDVSVPKYWLPEFMDSINKGLQLEKAVFNANKKVYDIFPTPSAWACLHLYGCPHLRIERQ